MKNLWIVGPFAIAMAYLESAVVVYLRRIYPINDLSSAIISFEPQIALIEIGREAATFIMLLAAGWLAGKKFQSRSGFFLFTFGVWDIFYYFWLKVFINWPTSWMDMDLLFLLPIPWFAPILAPVLIAVLFAFWGARAVYLEDQGLRIRFSKYQIILLLSGLCLVLYAFMADAISLLPANTQALSIIHPTEFDWLVFLAGFILLVFPTWQAAVR